MKSEQEERPGDDRVWAVCKKLGDEVDRRAELQGVMKLKVNFKVISGHYVDWWFAMQQELPDTLCRFSFI